MISDRYSIGDSVCGVWQTVSTKRRAFELARIHEHDHDLSDDQ